MQIERTFQHYSTKDQYMFVELWRDDRVDAHHTWFIKCVNWELEDMTALVYTLGGNWMDIKYNHKDFTKDDCPEFYAVIR